MEWNYGTVTLPFSFHPLLIFSYLTDAFFHSFRTHCPNLSAQIVVDHGGYFGGATDLLICGKSTAIRDTSIIELEVELLKTADLITPLISGTWPGSSTLWLPYGYLLEYGVSKRFLPIGYTTIRCSHVEREHQFASRTVINCSCRHVSEAKGGWETLDDCHQEWDFMYYVLWQKLDGQCQRVPVGETVGKVVWPSGRRLQPWLPT